VNFSDPGREDLGRTIFVFEGGFGMRFKGGVDEALPWIVSVLLSADKESEKN
jgi:hypothetical protein